MGDSGYTMSGEPARSFEECEERCKTGTGVKAMKISFS